MTALSRQDMQAMLDTFRNRLLDQVATKQDVQRSTELSRDRIISYIHDYLQQNQQQFIRQLDMRTKIYKDRLTAMESRIISLEQELRMSRQLMEQMSTRQQNVVIPTVQQAASKQETRNPAPQTVSQAEHPKPEAAQQQPRSTYGYNYLSAYS